MYLHISQKKALALEDRSWTVSAPVGLYAIIDLAPAFLASSIRSEYLAPSITPKLWGEGGGEEEGDYKISHDYNNK